MSNNYKKSSSSRRVSSMASPMNKKTIRSVLVKSLLLVTTIVGTILPAIGASVSPFIGSGFSSAATIDSTPNKVSYQVNQINGGVTDQNSEYFYDDATAWGRIKNLQLYFKALKSFAPSTESESATTSWIHNLPTETGLNLLTDFTSSDGSWIDPRLTTADGATTSMASSSLTSDQEAFIVANIDQNWMETKLAQVHESYVFGRVADKSLGMKLNIANQLSIDSTDSFSLWDFEATNFGHLSYTLQILNQPENLELFNLEAVNDVFRDGFSDPGANQFPLNRLELMVALATNNASWFYQQTASTLDQIVRLMPKSGAPQTSYFGSEIALGSLLWAVFESGLKPYLIDIKAMNENRASDVDVFTPSDPETAISVTPNGFNLGWYLTHAFNELSWEVEVEGVVLKSVLVDSASELAISYDRLKGIFNSDGSLVALKSNTVGDLYAFFIESDFRTLTHFEDILTNPAIELNTLVSKLIWTQLTAFKDFANTALFQDTIKQILVFEDSDPETISDLNSEQVFALKQYLAPLEISSTYFYLTTGMLRESRPENYSLGLNSLLSEVSSYATVFHHDYENYEAKPNKDLDIYLNQNTKLRTKFANIYNLTIDLMVIKINEITNFYRDAQANLDHKAIAFKALKNSVSYSINIGINEDDYFYGTGLTDSDFDDNGRIKNELNADSTLNLTRPNLTISNLAAIIALPFPNPRSENHVVWSAFDDTVLERLLTTTTKHPLAWNLKHLINSRDHNIVSQKLKMIVALDELIASERLLVLAVAGKNWSASIASIADYQDLMKKFKAYLEYDIFTPGFEINEFVIGFIYTLNVNQIKILATDVKLGNSPITTWKWSATGGAKDQNPFFLNTEDSYHIDFTAAEVAADPEADKFKLNPDESYIKTIKKAYNIANLAATISIDPESEQVDTKADTTFNAKNIQAVFWNGLIRIFKLYPELLTQPGLNLLTEYGINLDWWTTTMFAEAADEAEGLMRDIDDYLIVEWALTETPHLELSYTSQNYQAYYNFGMQLASIYPSEDSISASFSNAKIGFLNDELTAVFTAFGKFFNSLSTTDKNIFDFAIETSTSEAVTSTIQLLMTTPNPTQLFSFDDGDTTTSDRGMFPAIWKKLDLSSLFDTATGAIIRVSSANQLAVTSDNIVDSLDRPFVGTFEASINPSWLLIPWKYLIAWTEDSTIGTAEKRLAALDLMATELLSVQATTSFKRLQIAAIAAAQKAILLQPWLAAIESYNQQATIFTATNNAGSNHIKIKTVYSNEVQWNPPVNYQALLGIFASLELPASGESAVSIERLEANLKQIVSSHSVAELIDLWPGFASTNYQALVRFASLKPLEMAQIMSTAPQFQSQITSVIRTLEMNKEMLAIVSEHIDLFWNLIFDETNPTTLAKLWFETQLYKLTGKPSGLFSQLNDEVTLIESVAYDHENYSLFMEDLADDSFWLSLFTFNFSATADGSDAAANDGAWDVWMPPLNTAKFTKLFNALLGTDILNGNGPGANMLAVAGSKSIIELALSYAVSQWTLGSDVQQDDVGENSIDTIAELIAQFDRTFPELSGIFYDANALDSPATILSVGIGLTEYGSYIIKNKAMFVVTFTPENISIWDRISLKNKYQHHTFLKHINTKIAPRFGISDSAVLSADNYFSETGSRVEWELLEKIAQLSNFLPLNNQLGNVLNAIVSDTPATSTSVSSDVAKTIWGVEEITRLLPTGIFSGETSTQQRLFFQFTPGSVRETDSSKQWNWVFNQGDADETPLIASSLVKLINFDPAADQNDKTNPVANLILQYLSAINFQLQAVNDGLSGVLSLTIPGSGSGIKIDSWLKNVFPEMFGTDESHAAATNDLKLLSEQLQYLKNDPALLAIVMEKYFLPTSEFKFADAFQTPTFTITAPTNSPVVVYDPIEIALGDEVLQLSMLSVYADPFADAAYLTVDLPTIKYSDLVALKHAIIYLSSQKSSASDDISLAATKSMNDLILFWEKQALTFLKDVLFANNNAAYIGDPANPNPLTFEQGNDLEGQGLELFANQGAAVDFNTGMAANFALSQLLPALSSKLLTALRIVNREELTTQLFDADSDAKLSLISLLLAYKNIGSLSLLRQLSMTEIANKNTATNNGIRAATAADWNTHIETTNNQLTSLLNELLNDPDYAKVVTLDSNENEFSLSLLGGLAGYFDPLATTNQLDPNYNFLATIPHFSLLETMLVNQKIPRLLEFFKRDWFQTNLAAFRIANSAKVEDAAAAATNTGSDSLRNQPSAIKVYLAETHRLAQISDETRQKAVELAAFERLLEKFNLELSNFTLAGILLASGWKKIFSASSKAINKYIAEIVLVEDENTINKPVAVITQQKGVNWFVVKMIAFWSIVMLVQLVILLYWMNKKFKVVKNEKISRF